MRDPFPLGRGAHNPTSPRLLIQGGAIAVPNDWRLKTKNSRNATAATVKFLDSKW